MRQWTSQRAVIEIASLSLSQMVVSFPFDTERCLRLTREAVIIGDHVGFDYNCLSDSLLQLMLQHKMLKQPAGNFNMISWRRDVCDAVRVHLFSHDDERLWPVQRDENHHVCVICLLSSMNMLFRTHVHTAAVIIVAFVHCK